jgi:hypothetical protein
MNSPIFGALAALIGCAAAGDGFAQEQSIPPAPQPLSYEACRMDGGPEFPLLEFGTSELQLNTKFGVKRLKFAGRIFGPDRSLLDKLGPVNSATVALPLSVGPSDNKARCFLTHIRTDVPFLTYAGAPNEYPTAGWADLSKELKANTKTSPIFQEQEVQFDHERLGGTAYDRVVHRGMITPMPNRDKYFSKLSVLFSPNAFRTKLSGLFLCAKWPGKDDTECYAYQFISNILFLSATMRTLGADHTVSHAVFKDLPGRFTE